MLTHFMSRKNTDKYNYLWLCYNFLSLSCTFIIICIRFILKYKTI